MNKYIVSVLAVALIIGSAVTTAFAMGEKDGGKAVVFKIATGLPESHYSTKSYYMLAEHVEKKSNGAFDVQIFPANQLGDDKEVIELIQQGIVQMNPTGTSAMSNFEKSFTLFSSPYLFKNQEDVDRLLEGEFGKELLMTLESSGLKGLGFGIMGFTNISNSKRPIVNAEDLVGIKLRTVQNPLLLEFFREVGANPVPMSFTELFSALQQGVVDGQFNPLTTIYTNKFQEVQKYISLTSDIASLVVYTMSKSYYDALSPEHQQILQEGIKISQDYMKSQWVLEEKKSYDLLEKSGMVEINEVSDKTKRDLFLKGYPVIEKFGKEANPKLFAILKKELGL
ncbi:MAG: TRAP transporter substrate-binding protein [Spirochaetota bacterium]